MDSTIIIDTETYVEKIITKITQSSEAPKCKDDKKCAPGVLYEAGSCARLFVLVELAKAFNKTVEKQHQIKLVSNYELLYPRQYKKYLVQELGKRIGDKCTTQKCWTQQQFVNYMDSRARDEYLKYTFRPDSPQGKFEWLCTFDINDTLAQYERKYNDFKFFGAIPMDFADLPSIEVGHIDYNRYYKSGKTKLGVIFNLDDHDEPGSHWTSLFTDMKNGKIFYFDSVAVKPEKRVRILMNQQAKFLKSIGHSMDNIRIDYNRIQHQKKGTECGVYSINFLVRMARGDDFDKLCANVIPDDKMNKCRSVYFSKRS